MNTAREITGEFLGTFLMCFFGIGAVATASLFGSMTGPAQVGLVWGLAIAIAIYVTRHLSCAHFNPAVTLAMVTAGRMPAKKLVPYLIGQFAGAFAAALALWGLFADSVMKWLGDNGLTMMAKSSASSIWCEVFPNTSAAIVSTTVGAFAEGLGVFILVLVIFSLTESCNVGRPTNALAPLFIGLTVTVIICVVGPLTNAGLNPARDLGPRLVGLMVGFGNLAFSWKAVLVYTVAPLIGGVVAALVFTKIIEPMHKKCVNDGDVPCDPAAMKCHTDSCDRMAARELAEAERVR